MVRTNSTEGSGSRNVDIAKRFLQTAVVVDDEAYMISAQGGVPNREVVVPSRGGKANGPQEQGTVGQQTRHTLDARPLIDSFSAHGVICGVVSPTESVTEPMRQADIVVLDWRFKERNPQYTLQLLHNLLTGGGGANSLRLVAIYTGEPQLEQIYEDVFRRLDESGLNPKSVGGKTTISYRHGRVVIYAKSDVNLPRDLKGRSISEGDLPGRLVEDFSTMTKGLLPSIVLTSLAAAREGAHMVLDQFRAELDPAFLAHRVCLSNPDEAERQIVNHVAEELRGLMDNAVAAQSPAGREAVEDWVRHKQRGATRFVFGKRSLDLDQTIALAKEGLGASALSKGAFEGLSAGFAGDEDGDRDMRLAWIMSFRTVLNAPPPTLWLGSVLSVATDEDEMHLLCMRPRCDSVRLEGETSFLFLPLVKPQKMKHQLVVRLGNKFTRLGIALDAGGWVRRRFKPSEGKRAVTAALEASGDEFVFEDTCKRRYTWRGELKAEYAQRVALALTSALSRVAVDESEWLRRTAKKGH